MRLTVEWVRMFVFLIQFPIILTSEFIEVYVSEGQVGFTATMYWIVLYHSSTVENTALLLPLLEQTLH